MKNVDFLWQKKGLSILMTLILCLSAMAQESRHMTEADYRLARKIEIRNLEKDTYVTVDGGYVLDRFELKPAYVFRFNDSVERRIYLYLMLKDQELDTLGLVLFYQVPAQNKVINLCIPGAEAERSLWGLYIDDLKAIGETEPGFLTTVSFVLSKEFSALLQAQSGTAPDEEGDEYEYCFPDGSGVYMADGSTQPIESLLPGMEISCWSAAKQAHFPAELQQVRIHRAQAISLYQVSLAPLKGLLLAHAQNQAPLLTQLEATGSHPVQSARGKLRLDQLRVGDILYRWEAFTQQFHPYVVEAIAPDYRQVSTVYQLSLGEAAFLVNGWWVWEK